MHISKKTQNIVLIFLLVFVLTGAVVYYFDYRLNLLKGDYSNKITELNIQSAKNLQAIAGQLRALNSSLSSKVGIIDDSLQSFKKQNQQQISTLSGLIDQIEQQSNIKLTELRNELKDIQIKSADFSAIVDDVLKSVVSVKTDIGQGSGAIIDQRGYIVTNVHVISGATSIQVVTYSQDAYNADVAGYDLNADVAVLKINSASLKPLSFGNSDSLKVGEKVIAAGNPAGLSFTVTEGIVSALRTLENNIKYVQTDVPINPGNSGGPLINVRGEIVGINDFKVGGGFESLGFAISSNDVKDITDRIINNYESNQKNK